MNIEVVREGQSLPPIKEVVLRLSKQEAESLRDSLAYVRTYAVGGSRSRFAHTLDEALRQQGVVIEYPV